MKVIRGISILLVLILANLASISASADNLQTSEYQITSSSAYETTPSIGNDGTTDLVVYTMKPVLSSGVLGPADIWYQPLVDGAPHGAAQPVTFGATDDELNDVYGDYIVYTAHDSTASLSGSIMVFQISTGMMHTLNYAYIINEPRIHGDTVVWREGSESVSMIMRYELAWLGTGMEADILAGPMPPAFDVQIGSHFVVWSELENGQYDVYAYDLDQELETRVTSTPSTNEQQPATSGPWVVWQSRILNETSTRIMAKNLDTLESRILVENGAQNLNPSIDGDLVTWESDVNGDFDVFIYRLSTGETFQVTNDNYNQYLNDVFGNMVAYVDMRSGNEDIYASKMVFIPIPITVLIDIKPGSDPNSINLGSGGTVPVAILSTSSFDATTVDPLSITLANATVQLKGKGTPMATPEDVNGDGLIDLVVHVSTEAFIISQTDQQAVLTGMTFDGIPITGVDTIRVVP